MKTEKPDIRVLCQRCWMEYHLCGYLMNQTKQTYKEECWKCGRQGYEYIIKDKDRLRKTYEI